MSAANGEAAARAGRRRETGSGNDQLSASAKAWQWKLEAGTQAACGVIERQQPRWQRAVAEGRPDHARGERRGTPGPPPGATAATAIQSALDERRSIRPAAGQAVVLPGLEVQDDGLLLESRCGRRGRYCARGHSTTSGGMERTSSRTKVTIEREVRASAGGLDHTAAPPRPSSRDRAAYSSARRARRGSCQARPGAPLRVVQEGHRDADALALSIERRSRGRSARGAARSRRSPARPPAARSGRAIRARRAARSRCRRTTALRRARCLPRQKGDLRVARAANARGQPPHLHIAAVGSDECRSHPQQGRLAAPLHRSEGRLYRGSGSSRSVQHRAAPSGATARDALSSSVGPRRRRPPAKDARGAPGDATHRPVQGHTQ